MNGPLLTTAQISGVVDVLNRANDVRVVMDVAVSLLENARKARALALVSSLRAIVEDGDGGRTVGEICTAAADMLEGKRGDDVERRLREALEPFAFFYRQFMRKPIRRVDDILVGIHSDDDAAELKLSDCKRAAEVLEGKQ